ncbi:MAG: hypothetical protein FJW39_23375 [Acidobacteria bacterium]|nr:hypothetical protein [Acidobacteriota bacterium]
MRALARCVWIVAGALAAFAQQSELDRIRSLVEAGALPRKALEDALGAAHEADDQTTLRATLYGRVGLEEMTEAQAAAMIAAAERLWKRREAKVAEAEKLVALEVRAPNTVDPLRDEAARAREAYEAATARARLFHDLTEMARAEQEAEVQAPPDSPEAQAAERFLGDPGVPSLAKVRTIEAAYSREFGVPLPVTARGGTATHRTMGFDHTGRLDVGVEPDSREGVWLRRLLENMRVPFLAFRGAVRGQSTAAHIHIGPPSHKIRKAD